MLCAKIADVSDVLFVNFYRHEGTALMGLPADKLKELKDTGDIQVINEAYSDRLFRQFGFLMKVRARQGGFGPEGQSNVSFVC